MTKTFWTQLLVALRKEILQNKYYIICRFYLNIFPEDDDSLEELKVVYGISYDGLGVPLTAACLATLTVDLPHLPQVLLDVVHGAL